jgi:LL-diaminopimelate aminotransferase
MIRANENYLKLKASYLFSDIAKKVSAFQSEHTDINVIKLGIGDVTLPLTPSVIKAMHKAVDEMADAKSFRGYGPEQGYAFLREKIADVDFKQRGVSVSAEEVFISDGSKCDTGNIQELFATNIKVGIPDPVYPVYVDTNVMAGRTGDNRHGRYSGLHYIECTEATGFSPRVPSENLDLVYLCSPNNPTGATLSRKELADWVNYAHSNRCLLLFDAAYVAFIRDPELPHSIYEIDGAKEVAIEFRSFSKTAGFTGVRCAYTIVPKECYAYSSDGDPISLHSLWNRRHTTKFNGVAYPIQRAAEAVYLPDGQRETRELSDYYLANAQIISSQLNDLGFKVFGGKNAPYIWIKTGMRSWDFFDMLLSRAGVVCTPGSGFGTCGEGYVRLSAFNSRTNVEEALRRITVGGIVAL